MPRHTGASSHGSLATVQFASEKPGREAEPCRSGLQRIGAAGWLPLAGGPARGRSLNRSMSSLEAAGLCEGRQRFGALSGAAPRSQSVWPARAQPVPRRATAAPKPPCGLMVGRGSWRAGCKRLAPFTAWEPSAISRKAAPRMWGRTGRVRVPDDGGGSDSTAASVSEVGNLTCFRSRLPRGPEQGDGLSMHVCRVRVPAHSLTLALSLPPLSLALSLSLSLSLWTARVPAPGSIGESTCCRLGEAAFGARLLRGERASHRRNSTPLSHASLLPHSTAPRLPRRFPAHTRPLSRPTPFARASGAIAPATSPD